MALDEIRCLLGQETSVTVDICSGDDACLVTMSQAVTGVDEARRLDGQETRHDRRHMF